MARQSRHRSGTQVYFFRWSLQLITSRIAWVWVSALCTHSRPRKVDETRDAIECAKSCTVATVDVYAFISSRVFLLHDAHVPLCWLTFSMASPSYRVPQRC